MKKLANVCYHYIQRNDEFNRIWGHSLDLFKEHVDYLNKNYQFITPDNIEAGKYPSDNNLLISFDDGLKEQYIVISKYLDEHGIKGVFNIPTCILRNEPANPQVWHFGLAYYGVRKFYEFTQNTIKETYPEVQNLLPSTAEKMEVMELLKFIKNFYKRDLDYWQSRKILLSIYRQYLLKDFPDFMERVHLNADDIIQLSKNGHYIGGHTDTHCVTRDIINNQELVAKELIQPRKTLSNLIGQNVNIFTYPFGAEKDVVDNSEKLKAIGYDLIFTTFCKSKNLDKLSIGRYCPHSLDKVDDLQQKMWSYDILK